MIYNYNFKHVNRLGRPSGRSSLFFLAISELFNADVKNTCNENIDVAQSDFTMIRITGHLQIY
jgi:hypothetical protein